MAVVIAIIGLLSSIVLINVGNARDKARIAKNLEFSQSVHNALGAYAVGIWDCNAIEDNIIKDYSGYDNNGVVYGAALVESVPELGNALSLNGTDDYIDCGNLSLEGNAMTLEAWFRVDKVDVEQTILLKGKSGDFNYGLRLLATNKIRFLFQYPAGTGRSIDTNTAIEKDKWYYIVATFNRPDMKIYINSVEDNSGSRDYPILNSSDSILAIGRRGSVGTAYLEGSIDEVRIYNAALTLSQIQQLYAEGIKSHQLAEK